ncbi:hypothetical protein YenMTG1_047 [Yersinia phage vB_YenM_TG1]|uniref:Uncharacterized protein n=1 Tax=Yersinia phage vB_YenM_TG1 TaxID=1589265 RepID=A0A0B5A2G2_9CAUD|nr:thymidylate kinase [Yersinia phage vB_YenM_TG1]AJD81855.1 hypothetical protein YenMTG1_047 [Yersinia phage vB_YenM_TG1]
MARLILIDGPDNAGKTTMVRNILQISDRYELIDFPKRTDSGRFDIKSRNEVACFETMLEHLDPTKIYILDRGYISNWVYGLWRNKSVDLEEFEQYETDYLRLVDNHKVLTLILMRNNIDSSFKDDLISLSKEDFNYIISLFKTFANEHDIEQVQVLNHNGANKIKSVDANAQQRIISRIIKWGPRS